MPDPFAGLAALSQSRTLTVIVFCLIMLAILEVPLLGYAFAPEGTVKAVARFKEWITTGARRIATRAALLIGALLLLRGAIELLS
jgi:hypothetical protein